LRRSGIIGKDEEKGSESGKRGIDFRFKKHHVTKAIYDRRRTWLSYFYLLSILAV
jgi:hypothetical protein